MKNQKEPKYRVAVLVTKREKEVLRVLAWDKKKSMSGYFRFLLNYEINYRVGKASVVTS
jgi:hypothetical protein